MFGTNLPRICGALLLGVGLFQNAAAQCSVVYPGCSAACYDGARSGTKYLYYCVPCSGACPSGPGGGLGATQATGVSTTSEGNLNGGQALAVNSDRLTATPRQIIELSQVNPAAALALLQLGEAKRSSSIRLANGELAFIGGTPTLQTVLAKINGSPDETALFQTMTKMAQNRFAIVRWQTIDAGPYGRRLVVEAREVDEVETVIRKLFSDVTLDLTTGKPVSVKSWSIQ